MKKILLCIFMAVASLCVNAQNVYNLNSNYEIVQVFEAPGNLTTINDRLLKVMNNSVVDGNSLLASDINVFSPSGCIVTRNSYDFSLNEFDTIDFVYAITTEAKDGKYRVTVKLTKALLHSKPLTISKAKSQYPNYYNNVAQNLSKIVESIKKGMDAETDF